MSNRRATVSQADVARVIRACQKAGLTITRVIVRGDGVSIEAMDDDRISQAYPVRLEDRPPLVF